MRDAKRLATRQRVLDAAVELFVANGYGRSRVEDVAERAGVSAETIYATVGPKPALLRAAIDAAITGPDGTAPDDQPWVIATEGLPTPRDRLRSYVAETCKILGRTSALHAVIRAASDQEDVASEIHEALLEARLRSNRHLLGRFVGTDLRAGLRLDEAAATYCALSSPELHHFFTAALKWSPRRHQRWLAGTAERELLG